MPELPNESLDIRPKDLVRLIPLLRQHLPGSEVWAYGSRVKGTNQDASDLDLVVRNPRELAAETTELATAQEALVESNIPIRVELLDWARIPVSFQQEIEKAYVVIPL